MELRIVRGRTTIGIADHLRSRWNRRTKYTVVALLVLVPIVTWSNTRPALSTPSEIASFAAMTAGIMAFVAFVWLGVIAVAIAFGSTRLDRAQRDVTYEFNEQGHVITDQTGAAIVMPWAVIGWARESSKSLYLGLKPSGARFVTKRAFGPAELTMLRELLRDKLGDAAKLREG